MAYDPISGKIWAAVAATDPTYPNSVTGIDPLTGAIGPSVSVGAEPSYIAITDDGQFAYVSCAASGTTRRVTLASMTLSATYTTGGGFSLSTVPGSPHTFLTASDPNYGVNTTAWDDGVARQGTAAGGYFIKMVSPTRLYGNGGGSLFRSTLSATKLTWNDQKDGLIDSAFSMVGGTMYTGSGQIVDPEAETTLGHFDTTHFLVDKGVTTDVADNRAYFVTWNPTTNKQILSFDLTTRGELTQRDTGAIPGGAQGLIACDNHTVAFYCFGSGVTHEVAIIRQLP